MALGWACCLPQGLNSEIKPSPRTPNKPMKHILMKKFGPALGITLFAIAIVSAASLPASCSVLAPYREGLQALSVPASKVLSKAAVSQGWVKPGDEITVQRGLAVVVSDDAPAAKVFRLTEIYLEDALKSGVVNHQDTVTLITADQVEITKPAEAPSSPGLPPANTPALPAITPGELSAQPLPLTGG